MSNNSSDKIRQLKVQALEKQRAGDIEGAKALLRQAHDAEFSEADITNINDPVTLKKIAVTRKRLGDLDGAKEALIKAKKLEAVAQQSNAATGGNRPTNTDTNETTANTISQQSRSEDRPAETPKPVPQSSTISNVSTTNPVVQHLPPTQVSQSAAPPVVSAPPVITTSPVAQQPPVPPKPQEIRPPPATPPPIAARPQTRVVTPPSASGPPPPSYQTATAGKPPLPPVSSLNNKSPIGATTATNMTQRQPSEESSLSFASGDDIDSLPDEDKALLAGFSSYNMDDSFDEADLEEGSDIENGDSEGDDGGEFSDSDLVDVESLIELRSIGMELPPAELYMSRIKFYKEKALEFKRAGDIEQAKDKLRFAKQLEAAHADLGKGGSSLNSDLDMNDDEDEDAGEEVSLEDMNDPQMLADMISIGMKIPSPEDLIAKATQKKQQALAAKRQNDIENAKSLLREAKTLETQAENLRKAIRLASGDDDDDGNSGSDLDLEDEVSLRTLSKRSSSNSQQPKPQPKKAAAVPVETTAAPQPPQQSAAELKALAIALKKQEQLAEAAKTYRMYKEAEARESKEKIQEKINEIILVIKDERRICVEQIRLFEFYSHLGHRRALGESELEAWKAYDATLVGFSGEISSSVPTHGVSWEYDSSKTLHKITNDLEFLRLGMGDLGDDEIEICLVSMVDMLKNKNLPPDCDVFIWAEIKVGLPVSDADETTIEKTSCKVGFGECSKWGYRFRIRAPRDDSRLARQIKRKLGHKKVEIDFFCEDAKLAKDKKKWFGSSRKLNKPRDVEAVYLGNVTVELKALLGSNYIAGDFTLKEKRKEPGGSVRLVIAATGNFESPLVPPSVEPVQFEDHMQMQIHIN